MLLLELFEGYGSMTGAWFFSPATRKVVKVPIGQTHASWIADNPETLGVDPKAAALIDLKSPPDPLADRYPSSDMIDLALALGWVRCVGTASTLFINGADIEGIRKTLLHYRRDYDAFQIDVGTDGHEDSYRLDDPVTIGRFASAR
jgi:hypothetical protein